MSEPYSRTMNETFDRFTVLIQNSRTTHRSFHTHEELTEYVRKHLAGSEIRAGVLGDLTRFNPSLSKGGYTENKWRDFTVRAYLRDYRGHDPRTEVLEQSDGVELTLTENPYPSDVNWFAVLTIDTEGFPYRQSFPFAPDEIVPAANREDLWEAMRRLAREKAVAHLAALRRMSDAALAVISPTE